jgi:tetratricopeptide (TPR) repeat protein
MVLVVLMVTLTVRLARTQQRAGTDGNGTPSSAVDTMTADNAAAVIEDFSEAWRIEKDGTGLHTIDVKVKIREEAGIAAYGHVFVSYIANRQSVELASLVVQKPDGRRVTLDSAGLKDVPPQESGAFDAPMFSDLRVKQVTVPALAVGDELSYRVTISQTTPDLPGQFWTSHSFSHIAVILHESFEINWPAAMHLRVKVQPGSAEEDPLPRAEPGRLVRRWSHAQLTVGEPEKKALQRQLVQRMLGRGASADVQVTTFENWDQVGAWFGALARQAEQPSDAVRTKAEALTAGATTQAEKLARLHKFVSQDVRYVSLAFGPGRYQPRPSPLVLANAYGDCKDKHSLLAALARSLGIEVRPVLIGSAQLLDEELPSPLQFDHVISTAGSGPDAVWLDGTADGSRTGELVRPLRDKAALLISPEGKGTIVRTPSSVARPQRIDVALNGVYSVDGRYRLKYRRTQTGDEELVSRTVFRQADEQARRRFVEALVKEDGLSGTIKVLNVTWADVRDLSAPFWYEYEVESSYQTPLQPKAWTFWPLAPNLKLPAPDDGDDEPVLLGPQVDSHVSVRYELPRELVIRPPVAVTLDNGIASFQSAYTVKDGVLTIERHLTSKVESVPVDQLPAYKAFRTAISADYSQKFAVAATTATATPVAATPSDSMTVEQLIEAGHAAEGRRDYQAAVTLFQQVTAKDPKHGYAWNSLGWNLVEVGRIADGIAAYDKQIEVAPYHEYAYNNRGLALWRDKQYEKAEQSFRKQIEIAPLDKWAHTNLGLLQLERKQNAAAVESLERGASITPDDVRALTGLGRAYLAVHRQADALATFSHSAEVSASPENLNNIAWYLAEAGVELDRAQAWAEKAVSGLAGFMTMRTLADVSTEQLAETATIGAYWDTLGWVHFKKGHGDKALEYLEPAWELRQDPLVAQHIGQVYELMGKRAAAIRAYREAMSAGKEAPELSVKRLQALAARYDESSTVASIQNALVDMRTLRLPQLVPGQATGEVLFLIDGTGTIIDARFVAGDEVLKPAVPGLVGRSGSLKTPEGAGMTLVRRGALTCRTGAKCAAVLYRPGDVRSVN